MTGDTGAMPQGTLLQNLTAGMHITQVMAVIGFILILLGLWGILTRKHIIRMIISFSILDSGIHLIMVGLGYTRNGTAPIFDGDLSITDALGRVVDPIPSALVLTAIVIGIAVTALMLSYAVRLYKAYRSLSIDDIKEMKW
ncbi:MAG: sodium:proton antiporter [Spirochaetales bacterium]|nr:sodium:proton antiporter [Spirochaetales bacterium]